MYITITFYHAAPHCIAIPPVALQLRSYYTRAAIKDSAEEVAILDF
jgi:hypothetical protein